ncbi:AMP-binding protein [Cohnella suwonensis]|uniref:AMP-binding protein n=1 Tax=Cohnella suwonensis TaxID=696072 RepID=A0ABW0LT92_9BACL
MIIEFALRVDETEFGQAELIKRISDLRQSEVCRSPEGKRYAVLFRHPMDVLAAVTYLRKSHASVLLLHGDTPYETALGIAAKAGCIALLFGMPLQAVRLEGSSDEQSRALEPALCQFSSGTTGEPKLIVRPWTDVELEIESYNRRLAPSGGEPPLLFVPVSHSYGLIAGVMAGLARGASPHVVQLNNPKSALRHIRENSDSIVYAVPFIYQLLESLSKGEVRYRKVVSSGAPLTEALLERMKTRAGEVWQQYGCSESGCISLGSHPSAPEDTGQPLSHLSVALEEQDETREIVVRAGARVIRTGDSGNLSREGRLHVLGRLDDLINVSGQKVMPAEIEKVIGGMQGVKEVVVYGMRHPVWGEAVSAMIVADGGVGKETIREYCSRRLAGYKVPYEVRFVDEIPRPASGKISRRFIRQREE